MQTETLKDIPNYGIDNAITFPYRIRNPQVNCIWGKEKALM